MFKSKVLENDFLFVELIAITHCLLLSRIVTLCINLSLLCQGLICRLAWSSMSRLNFIPDGRYRFYVLDILFVHFMYFYYVSMCSDFTM